MAAIQRAPRDVIITADAEYQRLAEKHHQYEVELQNLARSPFLNSEDLLEEIRLKKIEASRERRDGAFGCAYPYLADRTSNPGVHVTQAKSS